MKWRIPNLILAVPVVVVSLLALHCTLPSDPNDPEKTSVNVVFKTADSIVHSNSVVETVRRQLNMVLHCISRQTLTRFPGGQRKRCCYYRYDIYEI
jgi:hypothetical protein